MHGGMPLMDADRRLWVRFRRLDRGPANFPFRRNPATLSRLAKVGKRSPFSKARCLLVGPLETHHDPRRLWPKARAKRTQAGGDRSHMKRSTDRILTTHTGSLPRTAKVIELLLTEQQARGARKAELNAAVGEAIAYVVRKQIESGIDIINDGEQG